MYINKMKDELDFPLLLGLEMHNPYIPHIVIEILVNKR